MTSNLLWTCAVEIIILTLIIYANYYRNDFLNMDEQSFLAKTFILRVS